MSPTGRLLLAGALIAGFPLIGHALGAWRGAGPADALTGLIAGYALAGLPYLLLLRALPHLGAGRREGWILLAVALAARLSLLSLPPLLSEDVWRYLWDGLVQQAGINPYRFAPADPALDPVALGGAAAIRAEVGHPQIPTIYPPFAQLVFAAGALIGPQLTGLRLLLVLADCLTVAGLWAWGHARGRGIQLAALYGLCPLAVVESAVGAHVDALAVAPTVWACLALSRRREALAGLGLALGIGAKLLPLLCLPWLALRRRFMALLVAGLAGLALALPFWDAGALSLRGLAAYTTRWRGNDGLFAVVMAGFEGLWPPGPKPVALPAPLIWLFRRVVGTPLGVDPTRIQPDEAAFAAAKILMLFVFFVVFAWLAWRSRDPGQLLGASAFTLCLVSPVLHPWYLLWPLAFAAWAWPATPAWAAAAVTWSLTAWLAYLPRIDWLAHGRWHEATWPRVLEYLPVLLVLALQAWRRYNDTPRPEP